MVEEKYAGKIFVIGDGHNDLPMIQAYHGFSVHTAPDEVRKSASRCFADVSECIDYLTKEKLSR